MKVLIIADIHSSFGNLKKVLSSASYDLIFIAGDLTNFRKSDVYHIDGIVSNFGEAYAVHGNCDYEEITSYDLDSIKFIHAKSVKIEDFTLHGVGGSSLTPFSTPSEYSDEEMEEFFKKLKIDSGKNFLLCHSPPKGILDEVCGINVGSSVIRKYSEKFDAIFFGHVHENSGFLKLKFLALNPGPLFEKRFAIFDSESFKVELKKI